MDPDLSRPTQDTEQEAAIVADAGLLPNPARGTSPMQPTAALGVARVVRELTAAVAGGIVVTLCFALLRTLGQLDNATGDGGQLLDRLVNDHW